MSPRRSETIRTTLAALGCLLLLLPHGSIATDSIGIGAILAKPGRLPADVARDARSRPDVTLPMLNLKAGDRVADIFAGGGYYSELLAAIVGAAGEVLLVNNAAYMEFAGQAIAARKRGRDIGPVTIHTREAADLDLGENTLDAALIIMSYHDLYHVNEAEGWSEIDADDFLSQIATALKPGGRFLVVDHYAEPGSGSSAAQDLHRIDPEFAKRDIQQHGFRLVGESDVLRNPEDDHSVTVFDESVRGRTDRFILVFEKT
ncbi:MAG: methyltransferase domain-containing protein [Halieaceae bacterium]|nr:methyltransferase domain-containing protein [Halieaceae bacterium]